jgi:hypothetical protein
MEHYKNLSLENLEGEIWRPVVGWETLYEISNLGRVKSLSRPVKTRAGGIRISKEIIMKQVPNKEEYLQVSLQRDLIASGQRVGRLVAEAFIANPENKPQVNHINGIRNDNREINLEWCTQSENIIHSFKYLNRTKSKPWLGKSGGEHCASIPVLQFSIDGILIKKYAGIAEAARETGVNQIAIGNCCKGNQRHSGNYLWIYSSEFTEELLAQRINDEYIPSWAKVVLQYDLDNNFITEFQTITYASKETGVNRDGIRKCCMGKFRHSGGFKWKFKK